MKTDKTYHRNYYMKNRERLLKEQKERENKKDPEKMRAYRKAYYHANKDRLLIIQRERQRKRYQANKEKHKIRNRKAILRKYGLTPDQYRDILDAQGGGCAICTQSSRIAKMVVDHCHKTGVVRGILCNSCNTALGLFGDYPERLMEASDYLTRSSSGVTSTMSSEE